MVNNSNSRFAAAYGAARILVLSLVACTFAASVAASPAQAAEVDALGAPAPIGFADVIERVKPAVVGVRVKVADTAPADDAQRRPSDAPARKFGTPPPPLDKPPPIPTSRSGRDFSSRATVMSSPTITSSPMASAL